MIIYLNVAECGDTWASLSWGEIHQSESRPPTGSRLLHPTVFGNTFFSLAFWNPFLYRRDFFFLWSWHTTQGERSSSANQEEEPFQEPNCSFLGTRWEGTVSHVNDRCMNLRCGPGMISFESMLTCIIYLYFSLFSVRKTSFLSAAECRCTRRIAQMHTTRGPCGPGSLKEFNVAVNESADNSHLISTKTLIMRYCLQLSWVLPSIESGSLMYTKPICKVVTPQSRHCTIAYHHHLFFFSDAPIKRTCAHTSTWWGNLKADVARHSSCTLITCTVLGGGVCANPWPCFWTYLRAGAHCMECENTHIWYARLNGTPTNSDVHRIGLKFPQTVFSTRSNILNAVDQSWTECQNF
jgi:hypothetical protein